MKGYYVTLKRAAKTAWLLGPFAAHDAALAAVKVAYDKACALDPWCAFDPHGTSSIDTDKPLPPGKLNAFFPDLMAGAMP